MREIKNSLARLLYVYVALPACLVTIVLVSWFAFIKTADYLVERTQLTEELNQAFQETSMDPVEKFNEIELIRSERLKSLQRDYVINMMSAFFLLLIGTAIPILACRQIVFTIKGNIDLLDERLAGSDSGNPALMSQTFDIADFDKLLETLKHALRERSETELRWQRAERQLVEANNGLKERAEELKKGRKIALSMMEDADLARDELEKVNSRLNDVLEQAQQSAKEADLANRAKSDFLATMSHEIRTPLNGIIGFAQMLSGTKMNGEQLEYLATIEASSQSLSVLINEILDFSKIESGHLELELREFNLLPMIRDLSAMFFNLAAEKGLSFEVELMEDLPNTVIGDETRIRQILTNLLSNAIKFTAKGGVKLSLFLHSEVNSDGMMEVEFEVSDTGIGIKREQLKELFKPFTQGDTSTTRKYGGTGLGLAICKRLSEAMGGQIWATSHYDQGSSFYTRLRLQVAKNKEEIADKPLQKGQPAVDKSKLKVVIAEDNPANQRVIVLMLRRLGMKPDAVDDGQALLDKLSEQEADLIFMDLQMPVMDGLEATAAIRAGAVGERMKSIKVVALTANAMKGDEERCLSEGMDAYLTKPIDLDVLDRTIDSLFQ